MLRLSFLILIPFARSFAATPAQMSGTAFSLDQFQAAPEQGIPASAIVVILGGMLALFFYLRSKPESTA